MIFLDICPWFILKEKQTIYLWQLAKFENDLDKSMNKLAHCVRPDEAYTVKDQVINKCFMV